MNRKHDQKHISTKQLPVNHSANIYRENTESLTNQEIIDSYDYLAGAASSQDCTGLIPSAPLNDTELDSYEELYPFLPLVPPPENSDSGSSEHNPDSAKHYYHPDSVR